MDNNFMKIIMNPVRQRIVQFLAIHEQATAKEILEDMKDIPPASLYRHIKILNDAGWIEVAEEHKIRGTIEKTWKLVMNPIGDPDLEEIALMFQNGLLSLMASFHDYFSSGTANPKRDFLSFSTSTLLLTDEEYMNMLQKIGNIFNEVIDHKPEDGRKPRRLTFISSPCEKEA